MDLKQKTVMMVSLLELIQRSEDIEGEPQQSENTPTASRMTKIVSSQLKAAS